MKSVQPDPSCRLLWARRGCRNSTLWSWYAEARQDAMPNPPPILTTFEAEATIEALADRIARRDDRGGASEDGSIGELMLFCGYIDELECVPARFQEISNWTRRQQHPMCTDWHAHRVHACARQHRNPALRLRVPALGGSRWSTRHRPARAPTYIFVAIQPTKLIYHRSVDEP